MPSPQTVANHPTYATDYIKADADKQVWLGNPHLDNLTTVALALGGEIWATRQRQAIAEKLAEKGLPPTTANIESYKPTMDEEKAWERQRQEMALRVYGVLAHSGNKPDKSG